MKFLLMIPLAAMLGGCATTTLYNWGGYDQSLYESYKDVTQTENMRVKLEAHVAAMEKSQQKVAPGLYAELGTLYLQNGANDKAIALYRQESNAWPESRALMGTMIRNLERRQKVPDDGTGQAPLKASEKTPEKALEKAAP